MAGVSFQYFPRFSETAPIQHSFHSTDDNHDENHGHDDNNGHDNDNCYDEGHDDYPCSQQLHLLLS